MEDKNIEQLGNALEKLKKLEKSILGDKEITEEVLDLRMLMELIREQVHNEISHPSIG